MIWVHGVDEKNRQSSIGPQHRWTMTMWSIWIQRSEDERGVRWTVGASCVQIWCSADSFCNLNKFGWDNLGCWYDWLRQKIGIWYVVPCQLIDQVGCLHHWQRPQHPLNTYWGVVQFSSLSSRAVQSVGASTVTTDKRIRFSRLVLIITASSNRTTHECLLNIF